MLGIPATCTLSSPLPETNFILPKAKTSFFGSTPFLCWLHSWHVIGLEPRAPVFLQSNGRSWLWPLCSFMPWHFIQRPLGNSVLLKEHSYFLFFTFGITPWLFSREFTCLPFTFSQACIHCCAICGTSSRVSMQSTIILCGRLCMRTLIGNPFLHFANRNSNFSAGPLGPICERLQLKLSRL